MINLCLPILQKNVFPFGDTNKQFFSDAEHFTDFDIKLDCFFI